MAGDWGGGADAGTLTRRVNRIGPATPERSTYCGCAASARASRRADSSKSRGGVWSSAVVVVTPSGVSCSMRADEAQPICDVEGPVDYAIAERRQRDAQPAGECGTDAAGVRVARRGERLGAHAA